MDLEIERLLFKQMTKPKNFLMLKAINVFSDYYRVNIYTQTEEEGLIKKRIGDNSYFCKYLNGELTIIPTKDKKIT